MLQLGFSYRETASGARWTEVALHVRPPNAMARNPANGSRKEHAGAIQMTTDLWRTADYSPSDVTGRSEMLS
jgi:hypothetical protein